jgi:SAM-dependent methyltransferase
VTSWDKYSGAAECWSDEQYADAGAYLSHRAELVRTLGPRLEPGAAVLDLACGDGAFADFLPDQHYLGVDASAEMVAAGRRNGRELIQADLNEYTPSEHVQATTIFRAIYYAHDRRALLERIAGYTEQKLVFDLNPRQYRVEDIRADVLAAGFDRLDIRPFFVPQTRGISFLTWLERSGPVARLVLRYRFTYLCAASRSSAGS